MAKLGQFTNVSNIRGKLGGTVFTKGRSGATLRLRVKPTNPRSTAQTNVRSILTAASRFSKAMTASQVTAYKAYSAGITKHNSVSGSAYNSSFINAVNALYVPFKLASPGTTFPTAPPAAPYVGDTITQTAAGSAGTITFTGSAVQTAGNTTFFMAQRLASSNRTPKSKGYRIIRIAATPTTPFQVAVASLTAGTYAVGYKTVLIATGQQSAFVALGLVTVT